jgi:hypothetical protein
MAKWTLTHENGSKVELPPRDARGLRLLAESGYVSVDLNTGHGPHPIAEVIEAQAVREGLRFWMTVRRPDGSLVQVASFSTADERDDEISYARACNPKFTITTKEE